MTYQEYKLFKQVDLKISYLFKYIIECLQKKVEVIKGKIGVNNFSYILIFIFQLLMVIANITLKVNKDA